MSKGVYNLTNEGPFVFQKGVYGFLILLLYNTLCAGIIKALLRIVYWRKCFSDERYVQRMGFRLYIYLFGVFRPIRNFFTNRETSPLRVMDCKRSMPRTHGQWAASIVNIYTWVSLFERYVVTVIRTPNLLHARRTL